jgi:hypothetical protein
MPELVQEGKETGGTLWWLAALLSCDPTGSRGSSLGVWMGFWQRERASKVRVDDLELGWVEGVVVGFITLLVLGGQRFGSVNVWLCFLRVVEKPMSTWSP